MLFELIVGFLIIYLLFDWYKKYAEDIPPGPPKVPILGSLPFMGTREIFHLKIDKLRQKYGNVIGMKLGPRTGVWIAGPKEALEMLKNEDIQGRPKSVVWNSRTFNKPIGLFFAEGPGWQEQRRFTIRHLRDFGFGKTSVENMIHSEIQDFFTNILNKQKKHQVNGLFNITSVNVIWAMLGGARFDYEDQQLRDLLHSLQRFFRSGNTGGLTVMFPILRLLPFVKSSTADVVESTAQLVEFLRKSIREHERTQTDTPRDFIDVYLNETKKSKENFDEENLISNCMDIFSAGAESVGNTLSFCVLYLLLHPDVHNKLKEEINREIGSERVALQDRARLPYVEAFLSEVFRVNSIAPTTPPHRVTKDTTIGNHRLTKNTIVFVNFHSLFHDQQHWGDPDKFRPERFIDKDGKYVKDDLLINFGIGRRSCPGEGFAKNNLFIFLTTLIQEYDLSLPAGEDLPTTVPQSGFTTSPQPFHVCFSRRKQE